MRNQPDPFSRFVTENVSSLLQTAFLMTWDPRESEDLVQECLLKVARRWPRVESMSQPVAYARRVLINLCIDAARQRARRHEVHELQFELGVESPELARVHVRAELVAALRKLPPRQRAVIVARYFLDLSESQTADLLGCSVGTAKSTASKALAHLRENLDPDQVPEVSER